MCVEVTRSCPTLCDLVDYIVCGILQARMLEWVAVPFSMVITYILFKCISTGQPVVVNVQL